MDGNVPRGLGERGVGRLSLGRRLWPTSVDYAVAFDLSSLKLTYVHFLTVIARRCIIIHSYIVIRKCSCRARACQG